MQKFEEVIAYFHYNDDGKTHMFIGDLNEQLPEWAVGLSKATIEYDDEGAVFNIEVHN